MQLQLAQTTPSGEALQPGAAVKSGVNYVEGLVQNLVEFIPNLLAAVAILLIGLLITTVAKSITRGILNRTNLDNQIAAEVMGRANSRDLLPGRVSALECSVLANYSVYSGSCITDTPTRGSIATGRGSTESGARIHPPLSGYSTALGSRLASSNNRQASNDEWIECLKAG